MKKKLLLAFLVLIGIKTAFALFIQGIILFPDESCFFLKGLHFANNFEISTCNSLLDFEAGNPFPAYSILISPIFLFLKNIEAFHAIQILNIILISSLIIPLTTLFKPLIKKENHNILISGLILLLPIVTSYEKMILSENLFLFTSIWLTYFYQKSFTEKKYLLPTIIAAILATLTRPFGFIIILAILINEFLQRKNKKITVLITLPIIGLITLLVYKFLPHIFDLINTQLQSLTHLKSYPLILKSLKNELITLVFSTLFIPCLIFFTYFPKEKNKELKKIKGFIISFIILNFGVAAQHIYGNYFLKGVELDFLTRYLNLSIIFITGFGLSYIYKNKKLKLNTIIFLLFIIPVFFINLNFSNHALNISISPYFKDFRGLTDKILFFKIIFPLTAFALTILLLKNKQKLLFKSLITIIIIQFGLINFWQIKYTSEDYDSEIFDTLKNKKSSILLLESAKRQKQSKINYLNFDYFRLKTLTQNKINIVAFNDLVNNKPEINSDDFKKQSKNFDYLITPFDLKLNKTTQDKKGYFLYNLKEK